jgi:hypothetical protein
MSSYVIDAESGTLKPFGRYRMASWHHSRFGVNFSPQGALNKLQVLVS